MNAKENARETHLSRQWRKTSLAVFSICLAFTLQHFSDGFRSHAGFSPRKIFVCGGSAGGHLALWTALNLPMDKVAGAISISGIGDMEPDRAAHPGNADILLVLEGK